MLKFEPVHVVGRDLDETWYLLLKAISDKGRVYDITEGSNKGAQRLSFDDASGCVMNPHTTNLAPDVPAGVVPPTTHAYIEKYFTEYLMDGGIDKDGGEHYKYGTWIVGGEYEADFTFPVYSAPQQQFPKKSIWPAIIVPNQFEWVIKHFKEKGFGNAHCYLTVGYPESNLLYDKPYEHETDRKTSPCLRGLDFRIIKEGGINYLTTKVIYRSWDLWGGWPTNMGGFALLNQTMASELGVEPGPLTFSCKDLHCYDFQLYSLKSRLNPRGGDA